jgi:hypothetical protein
LTVVDECTRQSLAIALDTSLPGKPTQNCYVESFNGKFRDECLNENWFVSRGRTSS